MGLTKHRVRNIVMILLVILSFYLSFRLWTAGREMEEADIPTGQITRANVAISAHTESDTFRPTRVALHGRNTQSPIQISRTYRLRSLIEHEWTNRNLNRIARIETLALDDYIAQLQGGSWLEFIYQEEMPIGIFSDKFNELSREEANEFFNRILINTNSQDYIYFYHTETEQVYVTSVLNDATLDIEPFLNHENLNYAEAFPFQLENTVIYLPSGPTTVPLRSYVIDQFSNSVYINSFFPDTSLVDVRSTENVSRYIDLTKEVTINTAVNTLTFVRQITDPGEIDPYSRYIRSFDQINRFENWSQTFVLADYDEEDESISFRREIDGFPVFSQQGFESMSTISLVESGVTRLRLPLRFISTPIDIPAIEEEDATKTLISGREVIETIRRLPDNDWTNRIQNILIGYSWEESAEDDQVVNFIPEWFIQVDASWMTFEDFLHAQTEEAPPYGF